MASSLRHSVGVVGKARKVSPYHAGAERWTFMFWDRSHPFRGWFDELDLTSVLELGCGHGRHSEQVAPLAGRLSLMDIHDDNIRVCRQRLAPYKHVSYFQNNGYDFRPVADCSRTAIFCYDAMVRFSPDLVASYLTDAARVLVPGGKALFHHSNHDSGNDQHYGLNPHARNCMTSVRFQDLARVAGLEVVRAKVLDGGGVKQLDGMALLRKPT